ncbi:MAG TPA: hypothetical protein VFT13_08435 [Candidatus Krumholzibacteria bacterium]|nr:hypothetical protein [Candidatus Krumholzibacteria bacterium]
MERNDEEKLARLLREAGPGPSLEPDPHLPRRIRALANVQPIPPRPRRLVPVPLAAAVLVVAIAAGGWIGYTAGRSLSGGGVAEVAVSDDGVGDFWAAWSQTGFAEDWRQWERTDGEQR